MAVSILTNIAGLSDSDGHEINFKLVDKVLIIDELCTEKTGNYVQKYNFKKVVVEPILKKEIYNLKKI